MAEALTVGLVFKLVRYLFISKHVTLSILSRHFNPFILSQTSFTNTTLGSLCNGLIRVHNYACILLHVDKFRFEISYLCHVVLLLFFQIIVLFLLPPRLLLQLHKRLFLVKKLLFDLRYDLLFFLVFFVARHGPTGLLLKVSLKLSNGLVGLIELLQQSFVVLFLLVIPQGCLLQLLLVFFLASL